MDASRFLTHSLRDRRVARTLAAALDAVEPGAVVRRYLADHPLPSAQRLFGLGLGKAAIPMTEALSRLVDLQRSLVITKHASQADLGPAIVIEGGHPVPNVNSLAAGQAALDFVSELQADDLLLCLISGGGSALMTAPYVPLEELQTLTSALLASGAPIDEINTLRRHLDKVKGGGIARVTRARIVSLILSDVVGSPLEAVASGPTAPDPTTKEDALAILEKYQLAEKIPATIPETLKNAIETPGGDDPVFERVKNVIVGDNRIAVEAALRQAEREGFFTEYLGSNWQGESYEVGHELAGRLRDALELQPRPFCLVAGGETTVTFENHGKGGRNQELALAAISELDGLEDVMLISLATDGEDGPTDAAGAVVTGASAKRSESLGLDAAASLSWHDAYPFFERLGDLLLIGPTGTNVNDLMFLIGF